MASERRRHRRVRVTLPVVVQTPRGFMEGETRDISEGGVFVEYSEQPELGQTFQVIIKFSRDRSISVTGKKAWCGNIHINGKTTYSGMGVRFIEISPEDRQLISALVEKKLEE